MADTTNRRQKLLLAIQVLTGRRTPASLTGRELEMLGFDRGYGLPANVALDRAEQVLLDAIYPEEGAV